MNFVDLAKRLRLSLKEDAVSSDVTTLAIPHVRSTLLRANLVAKEPGIFCGAFLIPLIFKSLHRRSVVSLRAKDGASLRKGQVVARITAPAPAMLEGERVMLNLVCRLSGIATSTNKYVRAVKGSNAKILETRKTTPLWRDLEKYAVQVGGGENHRFNLSDGVLVKDNHLALLRKRGLRSAAIYGIGSRVRKSGKKLKFVEIEAKTEAEVWEAIQARPDIILLDNMPVNRLKTCIVFVKAARDAMNSSTPLVEVSGGVTPEQAKMVAQLGVDRISVGALTHSARALDFSLEVLNGGF